MKLECQLDKLKNAITLCERITGKNLTLPVLSTILFIAKDNSLILRSTNLSIGIEIKVSAKIEKEGIVAINSQTIASFISSINQNHQTDIKLEDNNLVIKTKNNKAIFKSVSHEDFPTLPNVVGEKFKIESKKLIEGIKSVYYSSAVSDIKPEIGSVYLYKDDNEIVFVATDSFRLAEKRIKIKNNIDFNGVLIPHKNIIEIIRVLDNGSNEEIEITVNKNQISFTYSNTYITSRVVDGIFPDYKQIIPKEYNTEATILKQDFINALKTSNTFSDKFNQITLKIEPKNKSFEIYSKNNDLGESTILIPAVLEGQDVSANFNYRYITDSLQSIPTDSILISLNGANKPMVIKPVGDKSFMYLVMSMNH